MRESRISKALATRTDDKLQVFRWYAFLRTKTDYPYFARNLRGDCHCSERGINAILKYFHSRLGTKRLEKGEATLIRKDLGNLCERETLGGDQVAVIWGQDCFRLVSLLAFAERVRTNMVSLDRLNSFRGNLLLNRVKERVDIVAETDASSFLLELAQLPRQDWLTVMGLVPLSRGRVVWVTNERQLRELFAAGNRSAIEVAASRLALSLPSIPFVLLEYSVDALRVRGIVLRIPTVFDAGIDQGNFVPPKPGSPHGWTRPTHARRSLPEAVHSATVADILDKFPMSCI